MRSSDRWTATPETHAANCTYIHICTTLICKHYTILRTDDVEKQLYYVDICCAYDYTFQRTVRWTGCWAYPPQPNSHLYDEITTQLQDFKYDIDYRNNIHILGLPHVYI